MASAGLSVSAEEIERKVKETRQKFKSVHSPESNKKYDTRDVDRLEKDDVLVEAYLTWQHFVVDKAVKMIDESFHWRNEFTVNDITESSIPKWAFETGSIYMHGYDKEGNKLFWFRVKHHLKDSKTLQDKKRYVAFWLERYVRQNPGMQITVMFDMADAGLSNIDLDIVKYIISCFRTYYPKLLSKMVMYEMPWIMNAAWKIVKAWLDQDSIDKLKFVSRNEVQTYVGPEYLPAHMGGTDPFEYSYPPLPVDDPRPANTQNSSAVVTD